MSQPNYEAEVKRVYPDAFPAIVYSIFGDIPCGQKIVRYGRLFGLVNPFVKYYIGYGMLDYTAWQSAYETLKKQGKI